MTIYYVLFFSALGLSIIRHTRIRVSAPILIKRSERRNIDQDSIYLFLIFAFMTVIIGFRDISVGEDTSRYVSDFYNVQQYGLSNRSVYTEIVNTLLKWICGEISNDPRLYLVVHAIIVCVLFALFIKNNSEDVYLSTIIFIGMFFVPAMNLMRQWLAMAIGVTSFTYYQRNDNKKAIIFLILSVLCHTTAIVLIIIPLVERIKKKQYIIYPVIALSVIMIVFRVRLFSVAARFVSRYDSYLTSRYFMNEGLFNIKNLIFLIIIIGIAYILLFRKEKIANEKEYNDLYTYEILMILALAFSLCGTTYAMFHRVVYYFSVFLVIILPSITKRMASVKIVRLLVIVAMFLMLYRSGVSDNNGISNYLFFWE